MHEPASQFISLNGRRHHIAAWGDAANPVLLLVHGMRDHARNWDWVAQKFCDQFHVLAPDLRGHGDSDWSEAGAYSLFNYARDLADIIDTLGLRDICLIGHSMGGHIALRYAASFPEKLKALCIIEGVELPIVREQRSHPVPYPERLRKWIGDERSRQNRPLRYYDTLAAAQARMATQNPAIDAETVAHLCRHGTVSVAGQGLRWKYDNRCRFRAPDDAHGLDLDEILEAILCPTLLAYGADSWIPIPPAERLNRIRHHRVAIFENASHWLHHQAREPFLRTLASFLSAPADFLIDERKYHA